MLLVSIFIATLFLAYVNGANDNFKGVATLFGSRTASYQTAILWATLTTFAGAVTSTFLTSKSVREFSGQGILDDAIAHAPEFHIAVVIATALTVLIATLLGLPVSTFHSLIAAIFGAALVAIGLKANFTVLASSFLVPLFISAVLAIPLAAATYSFVEYINSRFHLQPSQKFIKIFHYFSAGIINFTRGFIHTSELVTLIVIIDYFSIAGAMITIAMAMALGGLLNSQKVAETMSLKITPINPIQGLSANIITSILVIAASIFQLPVSITYVAVGAIFGVGITTHQANKLVCSKILLAWILSIPIATIISGIIYRILQGSNT
ncbi:inorganic phosphate transporter [Anabaena sp. CA = ATCC 33047]|uniref:inorganic phosphate transporter n=1 Tax=Anabaena sp. (strain CA / ATCC 33047) TaxID=52271 RepID=UPI00082CBF68|nr:inorganic phosphate transporter [Anabaena sp. CA = ATCC 33047]